MVHWHVIKLVVMWLRMFSRSWLLCVSVCVALYGSKSLLLKTTELITHRCAIINYFNNCNFSKQG